MSLELISFEGHGPFVWSSFIFTFVCFFTLYLKTKRDLTRQEKLIKAESQEILVAKIEIAKQKKYIKKNLSTDLAY